MILFGLFHQHKQCSHDHDFHNQEAYHHETLEVVGENLAGETKLTQPGIVSDFIRHHLSHRLFAFDFECIVRELEDECGYFEDAAVLEDDFDETLVNISHEERQYFYFEEDVQ